jgi:hypothetical protein
MISIKGAECPYRVPMKKSLPIDSGKASFSLLIIDY